MTISIAHLYKQIGRQVILRDVNLQVEEGEVIGLLGPNGAGKSTLMKIIVGLWNGTGTPSGSRTPSVPLEGDGPCGRKTELTVCGVDMLQNPHDVAPYIGYLPENNPLYDDMYIREYLEFMMEVSRTPSNSPLKGEGGERAKEIGTLSGSPLKGEGKVSKSARVQEVIEMVGLQPEIGKKIGQLSKGYRQRVGLAQALLNDPKLLILDEPTTGLDPNQLEDIRALIRDLGKDRTVILSTHILQEVRAMCSRVVILSHGEIRADQPIRENDDIEQLFREKTRL